MPWVPMPSVGAGSSSTLRPFFWRTYFEVFFLQHWDSWRKMGMLGPPVGVGHVGWHCMAWLVHSPLHRGPFTLPLHIPCLHSLPVHTHPFTLTLHTITSCSLYSAFAPFPHSLIPHPFTLHTCSLLPCWHSLPLYTCSPCTLHTRSPSMLAPFGNLLPWSTDSPCTLVPVHTHFHVLVPICPCTFSPFVHLLSLCAHSPCTPCSPSTLSVCLCTPLAHSGLLQLPHLLLVHSHFPLVICFLHTCSPLVHSPFPYTLPPFHTPHSLAHSPFSSALPLPLHIPIPLHTFLFTKSHEAK